MSQRDTRLIGGIYRVGQMLQGGGMLATYTAYNRMTNDVVGLFVVTFAPTFKTEVVQQLLRPLELRQTLKSPHVLRVHNWGIEGNRAYIATDPPRGVTLQHTTNTENIELPRALDLARQITLGLKALHEKGVAGLDLRPQLITVDTFGVTDRVQIDDIGLRSLLRSLGYISSYQINDIGYLDPRYAPPEYINNGQIGPWSDIYQVGLLLFELITGRLPFVGRTHAETGIMQNNDPVPRMNQFAHGTPEAFQQVVDRALEKEQGKRFANATVLLASLDAIEISQPHAPAQFIAALPGAQVRQASASLTNEMERVEDDDITLRATHIQRPGSVPLIPSSTLPEKEVYAYLSYEKGGEEAHRLAIIQKDVVVGRTDPKRGYTPDIDLTPFDPRMTVSRQHARIRFEETFFYIEDLKSRNKTRLGQLSLTPLKPELLQHGDTVHFGSVRMHFEIPGLSKIPEFKERKE